MWFSFIYKLHSFHHSSSKLKHSALWNMSFVGRSTQAVAGKNPEGGNKHCFKGWISLQRDWRIFPENNGCLELLVPLTARTVPYRKQLMCSEEVRAATIVSTASCREEWRTGQRERFWGLIQLLFCVAVHESVLKAEELFRGCGSGFWN